MTRLGRWIDFKNDYKTMYPWYMESIWWIFKQMFDKGLVYKGFKVLALREYFLLFRHGKQHCDYTQNNVRNF